MLQTAVSRLHPHMTERPDIFLDSGYSGSYRIRDEETQASVHVHERSNQEKTRYEALRYIPPADFELGP